MSGWRLRPLHDRGDLVERLARHRLVERAGQSSLVGQHLREFQPQRIVVALERALRVSPRLRDVDVKREPEGAGRLQCLQPLGGQCQPVGVDDRLPAPLLDHAHDVHDPGMHERIAARDAHAIAAPFLPEDRQVLFDFLQGLVPVRLGAIATLARQIAARRDFEPGDPVVGQRPREAIVFLRRQLGRHGCLPRCRGDRAPRARAKRSLSAGRQGESLMCLRLTRGARTCVPAQIRGLSGCQATCKSRRSDGIGRRECLQFLAETQGFEPWMQVLARMLP